MLWLAIHFPLLPIESTSRASSSADAPWAVLDSSGVTAVNPAARERGIRVGMRLTAAHALCPALQTCRRDPDTEREALEAAALWIAQFTPSVAIPAGDQIVFEVAASLKLFGGLERILTQVREGLAGLGLSGSVAGAPTARAARCLARAGEAGLAGGAAREERPAEGTDGSGRGHPLEATLRRLPAGVLDYDPGVAAMLDAIGVRTIGELDALPRDGATRRFGLALLRQLDEIFGRRAETHRFFVPPERFFARLELPHSTESAEALLFAVRRLFVQLEGFLRARAAAAEALRLALEHDDLPPTEVPIHLVAPGRAAAHFAMLAGERIARLVLPAPVRGITLAASGMQPFAPQSEGLFPETVNAGQAWRLLVERMQARLGAAAVHRLAIADDHRPERASLKVPAALPPPSPPAPQGKAGRSGSSRGPGGGPAGTDAETPAGALPGALAGGPPAGRLRPLWLLREPQPIAESGGRLFLAGGRSDREGIDRPHPARAAAGALTLLAGPERIESGWWDGGDIARDYFVARGEDHALLWIFCQRGTAGCWFLHGWFG